MILVTLLELYVNSDGDKWELTEDDEERLFIRYTPNAASGGIQRISTMEAFLSPEQQGPPQDAVKKLIDRGELSLRPEKSKQHFA